MMSEDPLGGHIGDFSYRGAKLAYHVEGSGSPVLITRGLSVEGGTYDWRYIFDCLAGTFRVYALDVTGPTERPAFSRRHYTGLIESFIRKAIRQQTSIIASPREAPFALLASFEAPRLVSRVMLACPDGAVKIRTHGTIGGEAVERRLGIPPIEAVTGGNPWRLAGCGSSLRRYATGRMTDAAGCSARLLRSGAQPGGIDPLRFCEAAVRFLG